MNTYSWEQSEYTWEVPSLPVTQNVTHYTRIFRHSGPIRMVLAHVFGLSKEECEANARLIASAPELLEVCKKALVHFEHLGLVGTRGIMEDLKQAINKTKGI
jgi:hypothetical protein